MTTVVVGGGISGLVRAAALARTGEDVVVVEESDRPGGVVEDDGHGALRALLLVQ